MKVLVTGSTGQLGEALLRLAPEGHEVMAPGRDMLDLTDAAAVHDLVMDFRPGLILNAAAYTAVDRAENDEATAKAVNVAAVEAMARAATTLDARLIHVSTDFVFGPDANRPIAPDAPTQPLGVYGRTKLAGEIAAAQTADHLIVRTAWVYAAHGANFVKTMLRLMRERDEVRVVADQIGAPTWAPALAQALWKLAPGGHRGVLHYSDAGAASWYDFAVAIQEEAHAAGLLDRIVPVLPIATADYPTPAARPPYSLLDSRSTWMLLDERPTHWRVNLRRMIQELHNG